MSQFLIYPQRVTQTYSRFDSSAKTLDACSSRLYSIRDSLRHSSSLSVFAGPLGTIAGQVGQQSNSVKKMKMTLNSCLMLYNNAENNCLGSSSGIRVPGSGAPVPPIGPRVVPPGKKWGHWGDVHWWSWKDTWSVIGSFGIIGSGIGVIGELITGGKSAKKYLNAGKNLSKFVGNVAKAASEPSFDWRTLIGFNKVIKPDTPKTLFGALGKELDKYNMGNATKVSDKIAVGAKWAGSILTVATTAYDNFTDAGNSTGRAIAETIGESAVKIGGGILISAGVTAVLAAAGAVGAPAVVVGGITVGVTWGINRLSEAVTGKNAAEFISDTVIDGSIAVGKAVGKAVSSAGKKISGWWNKTFKFH